MIVYMLIEIVITGCVCIVPMPTFPFSHFYDDDEFIESLVGDHYHVDNCNKMFQLFDCEESCFSPMYDIDPDIQYHQASSIFRAILLVIIIWRMISIMSVSREMLRVIVFQFYMLMCEVWLRISTVLSTIYSHSIVDSK